MSRGLNINFKRCDGAYLHVKGDIIGGWRTFYTEDLHGFNLSQNFSLIKSKRLRRADGDIRNAKRILV